MAKIFDANSFYFDDDVSNFDALVKFDATGSTVVKIVERQHLVSETYQAAEFGVCKIKTIVTGTENYSNFIDLMQYVPAKFRDSVVLQQFITEAGLMTGSWIGDINDLSILVDKYRVNERFITNLAALIGFSFHSTSATTFPEIQKQLIQAIDWYKMKGTYQAYKYIGYILGLNLNAYDLYTQDYITFIREPWYVGDTGTLPPDELLDNPPFVTTSTTSLIIGTGTKSFTVETGLVFSVGQNIPIVYDKDNYMLGTLTSYDSGTGAMQVEVTHPHGDGTYELWNISGGYYKSPHFGMQIILNEIHNYSVNQLYNWSFEKWSDGINNPPDGWTFFTDYSTGIQGIGGNAIVQHEGHISVDTFSGKLTANQVGFYSKVYQNIHEVTGMGKWQGQTVTFGVWIWSDSTENPTMISIDDGISITDSEIHPGDGQFHFLTVTKTLAPDASILRCTIQTDSVTSSVSSYLDGAVLLLGSAISPTPSSIALYPGPDDWYLFDGGNTYSLLVSYTNQVRPVNTVPEYSLSLTAQTKEDGQTLTITGNVQTATIGDTWGSGQLFFDDLVTNLDDSHFFDFATTGFYNSILDWKLGTGNKAVNPSNPGFDLENPVLTGTMLEPRILSDRVVYTITVPKNTTQSGISELGLYIGSELQLACTFPDVDLVEGLQLIIFVNVYF